LFCNKGSQNSQFHKGSRQNGKVPSLIAALVREGTSSQGGDYIECHIID